MGTRLLRFTAFDLTRCDAVISPPVDPAWRTKAVHELARTISETDAFDLFPILADALEDAGCGDVALLEHCRQAGPHTEECWLNILLFELSDTDQAAAAPPPPPEPGPARPDTEPGPPYTAAVFAQNVLNGLVYHLTVGVIWVVFVLTIQIAVWCWQKQ